MKRMIFLVLLLSTLSASQMSFAENSFDSSLDILNTTKLQKLQFKNESLLDIIDFLAEVSGVDFIASDLLSENPPEISISLNKGVPIHDFIKVIAELAEPKLKFTIDNGIIMVAARDEIVQDLVLRTYDVSTLQILIPDFPGPEILLTSGDGIDITNTPEEEISTLSPDDIADLVQQFISPASWGNSRFYATIEVRGHDLLVLQSPEIHEEIKTFLDHLSN